MTQKFSNVFIDSLVNIDEQKRIEYLTSTFQLSQKVSSIFYAPETSAFVSGLIKAYDINPEMANKLAFAMVQIFVGEKNFAQLPAMLSTELQLPNDKAQKMAAEIEKDVFGPVRGELDEFLRTQKQGKGSIALRLPSVAQGKERNSLQNVLNLKELSPKKPQTQLPGRSAQKDLPIRPSLPKPLQPPNRPIRFT